MIKWFAVALIFVTSSVAQGFSVSIRMDREALLEVAYFNGTTEPVEVYQWAIPGNDFWMDVFDVYLGNSKRKYIGRVYNWPESAYEDVITLEPGGSIYGHIDISKLYDLSGSGEYTIRFKTNGRNILKRVRPFQRVIWSNQITEYFEGMVHIFAKNPPELEDGIGFHDCSSAEKESLKQAHKFGLEYSQDAHEYLKTTPESELYVIWFGDYDKNRFKTVKSNMNKIKKAFEKEFTEYFCGCTGPNAWVYTARHYEIHVCKSFFEYEIGGVLSQATIAIHEMSHFDVVAGTTDHGYGEKKCKKLAEKKPKKAIENADNYLFFSGYVQETKVELR